MRTIKRSFLLVPLLALGLACNSHAASIILHNTGTTAPGQVDPYYSVSGPSCVGAPACDTFVMLADGFPIPPYPADTATSRWIEPVSPRADSHPVGDYHYLTTFSLDGLAPWTAMITGRWMSDNLGIDLLLNGVSTGFVNNLQFTNWSPFTLAAGFRPGLNTLEFVVNNAVCTGCQATNPTALRVELTGEAAPIPEPTTMILLGTGLLGFVRRARRRR